MSAIAREDKKVAQSGFNCGAGNRSVARRAWVVVSQPSAPFDDGVDFELKIWGAAAFFIHSTNLDYLLRASRQWMSACGFRPCVGRLSVSQLATLMHVAPATGVIGAKVLPIYTAK
jgi:hypothetical protein